MSKVIMAEEVWQNGLSLQWMERQSIFVPPSEDVAWLLPEIENFVRQKLGVCWKCTLIEPEHSVHTDEAYCVLPESAIAELAELRATRDAAIAWWSGKRPFGWTAAEHSLKPLVNVRLSTEEDLIRTLFERPK